MIAVADIVRRVGVVLNDEDNVRWRLAELYDWINDAASAVVVVRPAAGAVTDTLTLAAGALQTLPADALELLDIPANADGTPVDRTSRAMLDSQVPGWRAGTQKATVRHFTFDDRLPTQFYVYPPVQAGVQVEALYSRPPAAIADTADSLAMDRAYLTAIVSYVLHRALAKDSEYANGQLAVMHYQAFEGALGIQAQSAAQYSPNGGEA